MGTKRVMLAGATVPGKPGPRPSRKNSSTDTAATHDEAAKRACLVETGPGGEDRLEIDYSGLRPRIRLTTGDELLAEGELAGEVTVDGKRYDLAGDWGWCCFHGDEDGCYLELELALSKTAKVEWQFFLARGQHRLACGETVVLGTAAGAIRQEVGWPLAPAVKVTADRTTRELRLKTKRARARFFPLPLPQDRIDSASGAITVDEANVYRTDMGAGIGLFTAMVIDWHPERTKQPAQWRTLTVTEEGRKLTRDEAAAYRLRLGAEQWLIYRQIHHSSAGRCVLGYHTRYETVVGLVQEKGEIKELLQIE